MARVLEASWRRFRPKVANGAVMLRRPLGVRHPHGGSDTGDYLSWGGGSTEYSRRSFLDGQNGSSTILDSNVATNGRYPGDGEPRFDDPPNRSANARQILCTKNSHRDVLEWKHTHNWNPRKYDYDDDTWIVGDGFAIDEPWWLMMANAPNSILHPTVAVWGYPSPVPLTDVAFWRVHKDSWTKSGRDPTKCIQDIIVFSEPQDIGETITWTANEYTLQRFSMRRDCRRWIYYEDCQIEDAHLGFSNSSFYLGNIRHCLREIDPRRVTSPLWDQGGTIPPAPDPKYLRNYNDVRFIPFGITDAFRYLTWENPSHSTLMLSNYLKSPWYEQTSGETKPSEFYDEYAASDSFTSSGAGSISANKVFGGLFYMAQPWARTEPVNDGYKRLIGLRNFDLLVVADFYSYRRWSWATGEQGGLLASGFAGAYGMCYAIY